MTLTHISSAISAIEGVQKVFGDKASYRTTVLLQMLLIELEVERKRAAEKDVDKAARND